MKHRVAMRFRIKILTDSLTTKIVLRSSGGRRTETRAGDAYEARGKRAFLYERSLSMKKSAVGTARGKMRVPNATEGVCRRGQGAPLFLADGVSVFFTLCKGRMALPSTSPSSRLISNGLYRVI